MSDNRYQLYLKDVKKLVATLVIKSEETVDGLNQYIIDFYGADYLDNTDPSTWKYYLNIAGEYHPIDTVMEVVSWDTLETIVFNKTNLNTHRATYKAYAYGTTQYKELVSKYPEQELLINGILNPVDLTTAINAKDGTILAHDTSLIESNEYSLLTNLEAWIMSFKVRWINRQFENSDSLYAATFLGIMYCFLIPAILNLRLKACKTNEAHSYHINEYLLSHGIPEDCVGFLNKKQALFLYRNIKYIRLNTGKKEIFDILLQNILTIRSMPLAEYVMKHQDTDQLNTILPTVQFKNIGLNRFDIDNGEYVNTVTALKKENDDTVNNPRYIEENTDGIEELFKVSKHGVLKTKLLESNAINYSDAGQDKIENILLNHWLYYSTHNYYDIYIGVVSPVTGERIPVTMKEAFTLAVYAFSMSIGIEPVLIPEVMATKVQRIKLPTVTEMLSVTDQKYIDESIAIEALSYSPIVTKLTNTEVFNEVVSDIHTAITLHKLMPAVYEHQYTRALVQNMNYRIYCDVLCKLVDQPTTYSAWLNTMNLNFAGYSKTDFVDLYMNIFRQATGLDNSKVISMASIQTAMIKLFKTLSSYSIQFVSSINSGGYIDAGNHQIRLGDIHSGGSNHIDVIDMVVDVLSERGSVSSRIPMDHNAPTIQPNIRSRISNKITLNHTTKSTLRYNQTAIAHNVDLPNVRVTSFTTS